MNALGFIAFAEKLIGLYKAVPRGDAFSYFWIIAEFKGTG